jgi:hypothetical protein
VRSLFYFLFSALLMCLAACSSRTAPANKANPAGASYGIATPSGTSALDKYIELAGFRLAEASPGKLTAKFVVINHSDADLGDVSIKVSLLSSATKPGEPPITEFEVKVPGLGPQKVVEATGSGPSKLRLYELPDWQFLRVRYDVTTPPPQ